MGMGVLVHMREITRFQAQRISIAGNAAIGSVNDGSI